MFLTSGNYHYVRLCLLGLAIVNTAVTGEKYEGESCETNYLTPGICQLESNCPEIRAAIEQKKISKSDPVHCSFWKQEEVICCPIQGKRTTTTTTTRRTPTTPKNAITTTTESPDFWLDLLTTTTTTSKPDFWLPLISTTTTTTSKPLVFDGKQLDIDSEFIDLNQLLQNGGRLPETHSERLVDQPHVDNNNINNIRNPNNNQRPNNGRNPQPGFNPARPNGNQNIDSFQNQNRPNGNTINNPNNIQRQDNGRNIQPISNRPIPNRNPNTVRFPNQNQNRPNNNHRNPNGNSNHGNGHIRSNTNRPGNVGNQNQNNHRGNQPNWPSGNPSNTNWQNQNPNVINPNTWQQQEQLNNNQNIQRNNQLNWPNGNPANTNWQNQNPNFINQEDWQLQEALGRNQFSQPNVNPSNTNWGNQNPNVPNQNAWQQQETFGPNQFNQPNGNPVNTNWQNQNPTVINSNTWQQQEQQNTLNNNRPNQNINGGNQLNWPDGNPTNTNWQNQNSNNMGQQSSSNNNFGPQIDDLETAASTNSLPNGDIFATPRPVPEQQQPNMDPINTVFNNLVNSGMDIVKAKVENVDRLHEQFSFPQDSNTLMTTTTTTTPRTTLTDPFAPFEFRPQPDDIFDTTRVGVWNTDMEPSNERPTTDINGTKAEGRLGPRAAIAACMEIEKSLSPSLTPHILDGIPVAVGEYPHMAAIGYPPVGDDKSTNYEFRCGGTLISNKFVLTAAHCVNSRDATPTIVRLGAANFSNPSELEDAVEIGIKDTFIHPNYTNSRKYDDIALLELEREITITQKVAPVCLYTESGDPPPESSLYVTGWGTINLQTRQSSDTLLKARLNIVPNDKCNVSYLESGSNRQLNRGVIGTQLCAGDPGFTKDACQGDSGGPLNMVVDQAFFIYRVVGVISTGFGCASAVPGLYTRVSAYLDYIEEIVWPNLRM